MNELALFAGGGGGILAGRLLGWNTVGAVEIEEYPRELLLARQRDGALPHFPIWDDVRTFDGNPWRGFVDVVTGGFPCQDISVVNQGKNVGLTGDRSGLWYEMLRIVGEVQPKFVFAENSPNLRTRGLGAVIKGLAGLGYDVRWCVLGAWHIGATHKRNRLWILAHSDSNRLRLSTNSRRPQKVFAGGDGSAGVVGYAGEPEPTMGRVDDGVSPWVDRRSALGNGQVPRVAATAFRILTAGLEI